MAVPECAAFGIDNQAMSISGVHQFGGSVSTDRTDCHRFLVGTCGGLRTANKLCMLEFRDDTRLIENIAEWVAAGPVTAVSCSPHTAHAAVVSQPTSRAGAPSLALMRLQPPTSGADTVAAGSAVLDAGPDYRTPVWHPKHAGSVLAVTTRSGVQFVDVSGAAPTVVSSCDIASACVAAQAVVPPHATVACAWDQHQQAVLLCGAGRTVLRVDTRAADAPLVLCAHGHFGAVRGMDFNPNRIHSFVTASDDGYVRFWDVRRTDTSVSSATFSIRAHDHACYSVAYNRHCDELFLTASADHSAKLWYQKIPQKLQQVTPATSSSNVSAKPSNSAVNAAAAKLKRGTAAQFADCGDAVYAAAWSAASPWVYAAVAFTGKVLVDTVPSDYKMGVLMSTDA